MYEGSKKSKSRRKIRIKKRSKRRIKMKSRIARTAAVRRAFDMLRKKWNNSLSSAQY